MFLTALLCWLKRLRRLLVRFSSPLRAGCLTCGGRTSQDSARSNRRTGAGKKQPTPLSHGEKVRRYACLHSVAVKLFLSCGRDCLGFLSARRTPPSPHTPPSPLLPPISHIKDAIDVIKSASRNITTVPSSSVHPSDPPSHPPTTPPLPPPGWKLTSKLSSQKKKK